jgi:phospholipid transport system substrate-binding protein
MSHDDSFALAFSCSSPSLRPQRAGARPDELVSKVTADVLDTIKSDKQLQAGDRARTLALGRAEGAAARRLPRAAQLATGKSWHAPRPTQQTQLLDAIPLDADPHLLERDRRLPRPDHEGAAGAHAARRDRSRGAQPVPRDGRPPVSVEYAMKKEPEGWKIYDITV